MSKTNKVQMVCTNKVKVDYGSYATSFILVEYSSS